MVHINGILAVVITIVTELIHSVAGAMPKKEIYEKVPSFTNLDTTDTPLMTSSVATMGECARLCFEEPVCGYQRLFEGRCALFRSTPVTRGGLQGAKYFTKFGDECPVSKGYISVHAPRLCFMLSDASDTRTWSDAQSQCQGDGARLIILNTEGRHDIIVTYMTEKGHSFAFVGMEKVNGVFKWSDGSEYVKKWDEGEPDYLSYQNCGALWANGMGDIQCNNPRPYICEILMAK